MATLGVSYVFMEYENKTSSGIGTSTVIPRMMTRIYLHTCRRLTSKWSTTFQIVVSQWLLPTAIVNVAGYTINPGTFC